MYGTYQRLGLCVTDSDMEVVRRARKVISRKHRNDNSKIQARKEFYASMLEYHQEERELYGQVMGVTK